MSSSYVENLGNGKFKISELPTAAQLAPIYGILPYDIDQDGLLDIVMVGNDFGMELLQGRADAFNGLILKNKGKNQFAALSLNESSFFVPGDARALTRLTSAQGQEILLATQNRGALKAFAPKLPPTKIISLAQNEVKAQLVFKNGQKQMRELYWGSSFLSQESRSICLYDNMQEIRLFDAKNQLTRTVNGLAMPIKNPASTR